MGGVIVVVAEIWRKLGYTEEQSEELEMLSTINNDDIKNIDSDTATKTLLEAMKKYQLDKDEVEKRINEIPCQSFRIEDILTCDFGIQTRNNDGTFRTLYDVLNDASKVYWSLNERQRKILRELVFGGYCNKNRFEEYMSE